MARAEHVSLEGEEKIKKKFLKMAEQIGSDIGEQIMVEAIKPIRDRAEANAPIGPTGNLRRGMAIFGVAHPRKRNDPAAFVKPDYRKAPHFHLIEFGTKYMPANPFFARSIRESRGQVLYRIEKGMRNFILNPKAGKSGFRLR